MNAYETVQHLINETDRIDSARRTHSKNMARLLVGNLKHCHGSELNALKRELANYNMHTGEWKQNG